MIADVAPATGGWTPDMIRRLVDRMAEGLRAISMCVFMAALALFPHARRGRGRRRSNWCR